MSPARKLPEWFRARGLLPTLNVLAVGSALSAVTATALYGDWTGPVLLSTFIFGSLWAALLRPRARNDRKQMLRRWLLSIPFAAGNAALAAALAFNQPGAALLGATFGVIIWGPALLATFVCFGLPLAWAQQRAERGLAGREQGELVVGAAAALMSVVALIFLDLRYHSLAHVYRHMFDVGANYQFRALAIAVMASIGAVAGSLSAAFSLLREMNRRNFVRAVERGEVAGFRVDPSPLGKVLMRLPTTGETYRVQAYEEEIYLLDHSGAAVEDSPRRLGLSMSE